MGLTEREVKTIQHWYKDFDPTKVLPEEEAKGKSIRVILLVSKGLKALHSGSKYPIITTIGIEGKTGTKPANFYSLGTFHDAISINAGKVGIDCLGKNVFQIWTNSSDCWKVADYFSPISTLNIGCEFPNIAPKNQIL